MNAIRTIAVAAALAAPTTALAHTGHGAGLSAGLLHPLGGLDHLLAFFAMGFWAAGLRGRAGSALTAGLAAMAVGAVLGMNDITLPGVEYGILASVFVVGLLIAVGARVPQIGLPLVAGFALLHGQAHGAEMPALASAVSYTAGFLATTAAIQFAGLQLGRRLLHQPAVLRAGGALMAGSGLLLALAR